MWVRCPAAILLAATVAAPPAVAQDATITPHDNPSRSTPLVAQKQQPTAASAGRLDPALRDAAEHSAGALRLTSADGERRCDLTLGLQAAGSGLALAWDRAACTDIGFMAQVGAWLPEVAGGLRLLTPQGRTVAEFTPATQGSFEALREGDGVYFLAPPAATDAALATPEEVLGDWLVSREAGSAVCRWTLLEAPATGGGGRLTLSPPCDEPLTRFAPVAWELVGGNILVRGSDGSTIRFARQDDGTWSRVPERSRPLVMTRP